MVKDSKSHNEPNNYLRNNNLSDSEPSLSTQAKRKLEDYKNIYPSHS